MKIRNGFANPRGHPGLDWFNFLRGGSSTSLNALSLEFLRESTPQKKTLDKNPRSYVSITKQ